MQLGSWGFCRRVQRTSLGATGEQVRVGADKGTLTWDICVGPQLHSGPCISLSSPGKCGGSGGARPLKGPLALWSLGHMVALHILS